MTSTRKKAPAAPAQKRKKPLRDLRDAFLAAFFTTCSVSESADQLGIDRSQHYRWLKEPDYKLKFDGQLPEARGLLIDRAVTLSLRGVFEPLDYKGEYCYEKRKRTMCQMKDGTTKFLDELSKNDRRKILERKTVVTKDGPQLGVFRPDTGLLAKLLSAWVPEFSNKVQLDLNVTDRHDTDTRIDRKLAGIAEQGKTESISGQPR